MSSLNELVSVYNNDAIIDKNQTFEYTKNFIDDRLRIIKEELSDVEKDVEDFKQKNRLTNLIFRCRIVYTKHRCL